MHATYHSFVIYWTSRLKIKYEKDSFQRVRSQILHNASQKFVAFQLQILSNYTEVIFIKLSSYMVISTWMHFEFSIFRQGTAEPLF